mmetsp:Transcript_13266/g.25786  ORF Transcript_13266/g.25786 Transcript_13266/m.25786 type:complete len:83 (-) Transcript_13266:349-597(-)
MCILVPNSSYAAPLFESTARIKEVTCVRECLPFLQTDHVEGMTKEALAVHKVYKELAERMSRTNFVANLQPHSQMQESAFLT